jgi:FKBP-type peptidyl-prolyl cis-trans isomerase SlyD
LGAKGCSLPSQVLVADFFYWLSGISSAEAIGFGNWGTKVYFRYRKSIQSLFTVIVVLLYSLPVLAEDQSKIAIGPGKVVSLSYTVSLPDGKVVHSNVDGHPIKYRQGDGTLLPALEAALAGMAAGDKKSVTLSPEETYPVDEAAFREVPIEQIPEDSRQVDAVFIAIGSRGTVRVVEIKENTAVIDLNHPLAGKTLTYEVTIVSVE